jgi:hypothetical protein
MVHSTKRPGEFVIKACETIRLVLVYQCSKRSCFRCISPEFFGARIFEAHVQPSVVTQCVGLQFDTFTGTHEILQGRVRIWTVTSINMILSVRLSCHWYQLHLQRYRRVLYLNCAWRRFYTHLSSIFIFDSFWSNIFYIDSVHSFGMDISNVTIYKICNIVRLLFFRQLLSNPVQRSTSRIRRNKLPSLLIIRSTDFNGGDL